MLQQRPQEAEQAAPLQRYLDDLQKPMTTLGEAAQQEWRAEAQSHLESLIAAYEELGDTHEDAVRAALAQFGEPKTLGFRMRWASLRQTARQNPESRVTSYILNCCACFFLPALLSFLAFIFLYVYTDNHAAQALARNVTGAILLVGPFLSGWLLGRRLPWLQNEVRRVRTVQGPRGITRLRFALTIVALSTSLELALFWSLVRTLSDGTPAHVIAQDLLPALAWLPITLGVAYGRARRTTTARANEDAAPV